MHRLLSRRDKHTHEKGKKEPLPHVTPLDGTSFDEEGDNSDTEEDQKIKTLAQRLSSAGITKFKAIDIRHVLNSPYANGNSERAWELVVLLQDSEDGLIRLYNPSILLLGAVNRGGVTCYLDALLFAMFARLGSFEAMLYEKFEDGPKKSLATVLRLWVNMLRAGKLITVDIAKQIQLQLASCGWKEAAQVCQQDASEAFTFITSTLALPLLTLKMDIFHTGKENLSDDHRFVNERLLELAIPEVPNDEQSIKLEDCLEMYFNNRIEVKRYLSSIDRRNTSSSIRSRESMDPSKAHASHVEIAEIGDSQPSSPVSSHAQFPAFPVSSAKSMAQRQRAPSIIQEHLIEKAALLDAETSIDEKTTTNIGRVRREVVMPAWQFFSLIPWYTDNVPSNDAQVAAHLSNTRPILGICLKRYSMLPNGTAVKRRTHIDIPIEIGLPHFIQDDKMAEDGPAFGNFKLSLQSVVCHQGVSVDSGHYICAVRNPDPKHQGEDSWMRFDDLASQRVTYVDVEQFLRDESPYLLFYQVIPIEGDSDEITDDEKVFLNGVSPPPYSESTLSHDSKVDSGVSGLSFKTQASHKSHEDPLVEIPRPSIDASTVDEGERGRSSTSERPQSVVFSDAGVGNSFKIDFTSTLPPGLGMTDGSLRDSKTETSTNGLNVFTASRRGSRTTKTSSKSRPSSRSRDERKSTSLSRLASRLSKDRLSPPAMTPAQPETSEPVPANSTRTSLSISRKALPSPLVAEGNRSNDKARLKKEAREKSKTGYREPRDFMRRGREGKPERECTIM